MPLSDGRVAAWLVRSGAATVNVNVIGGAMDGCTLVADGGRTWVIVEAPGDVVDHETLEFRQGRVVDGHAVWRPA